MPAGRIFVSYMLYSKFCTGENLMKASTNSAVRNILSIIIVVIILVVAATVVPQIMAEAASLQAQLGL
jgi:hypothetical protein